MIPSKARKVAHYYYSDGNELVVFAHRRRYFVRDGKTGGFPVSPITGASGPHPGEGFEHAMDYEALGLYYKFEMKDTGWSGDC